MMQTSQFEKCEILEYAVKMEEAIFWESQVNSTNKDCYKETKAAFEYIRNATYTATGRAELNGVFKYTRFWYRWKRVKI